MEVFGTLLSGSLQASAQAFDGTLNLLDITHQANGPISSLLLQSLQGAQAGASAQEAPEQSTVVHHHLSSAPLPRAQAKSPVAAPAKPLHSTPKQAPPVTGSIWDTLVSFSLVVIFTPKTTSQPLSLKTLSGGPQRSVE